LLINEHFLRCINLGIRRVRVAAERYMPAIFREQDPTSLTTGLF
jgi:hypothetical protein